MPELTAAEQAAKDKLQEENEKLQLDAKAQELTDAQKTTLGKLSHKNTNLAKLATPVVPSMKRSVKALTKKVYCGAWCEDSQHIVVAGQEGKVIVFDALGNHITHQPVKCKFVMQCAAHLGKGFLACGGMNNLVEFHSIKDPSRVEKIKDFEGHEGYISALHFVDGGNKLLSGSGDGYAKLWDLEKKTEIQTFIGHVQDVSGVAINVGSKVFATSSTDKSVRVWDTREKYAVRKFKTKYGANCCAMMPEDKGVLAGCDSASWEFFDIGCNNQVARGKVKKGRCESVAVSSSGRVTYLGWDDFNAGITIVDTYNPEKQKSINAASSKDAHTHACVSLAVAPDGSALLSGSFDCTAKVWAM